MRKSVRCGPDNSPAWWITANYPPLTKKNIVVDMWFMPYTRIKWHLSIELKIPKELVVAGFSTLLSTSYSPRQGTAMIFSSCTGAGIRPAASTRPAATTPLLISRAGISGGASASLRGR